MQTLAIMTIKANKFFIMADTSLDEGACNGITGSRWIDGQCYALASTGKVRNQVGDSEVRDTVSYMDKDKVHQLDDPSKGYHFDVNLFYQNAKECQDKGGGNVDLGSLVPKPYQTSGYPPCFVNIPVIKADQSPCNDGSHDWSTLGFDKFFCNLPPKGGGPPCPNHICHKA
jgi:hypothetical protein